jgi:hypothetical protein
MTDVSISEAIALFDHSETARGSKGAVGKWPMRVIERLRYLHDTDEIGFENLPAKIIGGWGGHQDGFDLALSRAYVQRLPERERLPFVSLVLVHEGVHATDVLGYNWIYDEMMGRKLSIYYYRELAGPGVVNVLTGERVGVGKSDIFEQFREMDEYMKKDQLVDYVLYIPLYTGPEYLDKDWIVDNFNNWGGMKNRWASTRRLYARKLLRAARGEPKPALDPYYAVRLLGILESIEERAEWDDMIAAIKKLSRDGSLWTLQVSFESLLGNRSDSVRIGTLEQRWGTALTERPGGRPSR